MTGLVDKAAIYRYRRQSGVPDWRWRTARSLIERKQIPRHDEVDQAILSVWHHLRGIPSPPCGDFLSRVADAVAIRRNPTIRRVIEARLLAGQSVEEVAAKTRQSETTIREYIEIFFDVPRRLTAKRWIVNQVIEGRDREHTAEQKALYRSSYFGGPRVCEYWLDHWDQLASPTDLSSPKGRELERLRLMVAAEVVASEDTDRFIKRSLRFGQLPVDRSIPFRSVKDLLTERINRQLRDITERAHSIAGSSADITTVPDTASNHDLHSA